MLGEKATGTKVHCLGVRDDHFVEVIEKDGGETSLIYASYAAIQTDDGRWMRLAVCGSQIVWRAYDGDTSHKLRFSTERGGHYGRHDAVKVGDVITVLSDDSPRVIDPADVLEVRQAELTVKELRIHLR